MPSVSRTLLDAHRKYLPSPDDFVSPSEGFRRNDLNRWLYSSHGFPLDPIFSTWERVGLHREYHVYALAGVTSVYLTIGDRAPLVSDLLSLSYPVYSTLQSLSDESPPSKWLIFWSIYAVIRVFDGWMPPPYWLVRTLFLTYLYLPQTNGATAIRKKIIDPIVAFFREKYNNLSNDRCVLPFSSSCRLSPSLEDRPACLSPFAGLILRHPYRPSESGSSTPNPALWSIVLLFLGVLSVQGRPPDYLLFNEDPPQSSSAENGATGLLQVKRDPRGTENIKCDDLQDTDNDDEIEQACFTSSIIKGPRQKPVAIKDKIFLKNVEEYHVPIIVNNTDLDEIPAAAKEIKKGGITVTGNTKMTVLDFQRMTNSEGGDLVITNNPVVTSIKLSELEYATGITIDNNAVLAAIELDKLKFFKDSNIIFSNNDAVESISLKALIDSRTNAIEIHNNKKLKNVNMPVFPGGAVISNNPSLESVTLSSAALTNIRIYGNKNMKKDSLDAIRGNCAATSCYIQQEKECIVSSPLRNLAELDGCEGIYGNLIIDPAVTGETTTMIKYITGNLEVVNSTTMTKDSLQKIFDNAKVKGTVKLVNNILICGVQEYDLVAIFQSLGQKDFQVDCPTTVAPTSPSTAAPTTDASTEGATTSDSHGNPHGRNNGHTGQGGGANAAEEEYETCEVPPPVISFAVIWFTTLLCLAVGSHVYANHCERRLKLRTLLYLENLRKTSPKGQPPRGAKIFGFPLKQDMVFEFIPTKRLLKNDKYHRQIVGQLIKFAKDYKFEADGLIHKHHWHRAYYHEYCHPFNAMTDRKENNVFSVSHTALFLADHSRVQLNASRWRMSSDFFNASFLGYPRKMPRLLKHPHEELYNDEMIWLDNIGNIPNREEDAEDKKEGLMNNAQYTAFEALYLKAHPGEKPRKIEDFHGGHVDRDLPKSVTPPQPSPNKANDELETIDRFEDMLELNDKPAQGKEQKRTGAGLDYKKYTLPDEVPGLLRRDRPKEILPKHLQGLKNLRRLEKDRLRIRDKGDTEMEYPKGSIGRRILEFKEEKVAKKNKKTLPEARPLFDVKRIREKVPRWHKKKKRPVKNGKEFQRVMHKTNLKKTKAKRLRQLRFLKIKTGYGPHGDKVAEHIKSWPAKGLHDRRMGEHNQKMLAWFAERYKKTQRNVPVKEAYVPALFTVREMDVVNAYETVSFRRSKRRRNPTLLNKLRLRLVRLRRRIKKKAEFEECKKQLLTHKGYKAFEKGSLTKRMGTKRKRPNQSPFPDQLKPLKNRLQGLQEKKRRSHLAKIYRQRKHLCVPKETFRRETKYICSQHPQMGQEYSFWSMVVDNHVRSIVSIGHEVDTLTSLPLHAIYNPISNYRGGPVWEPKHRQIHVDVERRGWLPPENILGKEPMFEQYHNEAADHRPAQDVQDYVVGVKEVKGEDPYTKNECIYLQQEIKQCVLVSQLTIRVPSLNIRRTVYHFQYFNWETHQRPRMTLFLNLLGAVGKIGGSVLTHDVEGCSQAPCFLGAAMLLSQIRQRQPITDPLLLFRQMRQDRLGCLTRTKYFLIIIQAVFHFVFIRYRIFFGVSRAPYYRKVRVFMKKLKEMTKENNTQ